jgi:undecaprenyl-diphosphatase
MSFTLDFGPAFLLGIIQGLTEFLPVSSDGHLTVAQFLLGMQDAGLALILLVHAGTLLSVALVFHKQLARLAHGFAKLPAAIGKHPREWGEDERLAGLVVLTTLPGAMIGLLFRDLVEKAFGSLLLTGIFFLVTGTILALTRWAPSGRGEVTWKGALLIGLAQAAAILPGVSRSGSTIAAALFLGVARPKAGEFSFVASVPIILGAVALELPDIARESLANGILPLVLAFAASFFAGWIALVWLLRIVRHGKFHWFAPYCFAIGIATILLAR